MYRVITFVSCVFTVFGAYSQNTNYYNSQQRQNAEYKSLSAATQRAYSVPTTNYSTPAYKSTTSNTTGSTSNSSSSTKINSSNSGYVNIGGGDRIKRQQAAGNSNDARITEWNKKVEKYEELSKGIEETPANYDRLVKLAEQAGIDYYSATRMLGYLKPRSCQGTCTETIIASDNQSTYTGNTLNGIPHGKGKVKWNDGTTYEGDIVNGQLEGQGTTRWTSGVFHSGSYRNSRFHGEGTLTYESGTYFKGNYVEGEITGKGTYKSELNEYIGNFKQGKYDGEGVLKTKSSIVTADFKEDKPVYGTIIYLNNKSEFTGFIREDYSPKVGEYHTPAYTHTGWYENVKENGYGLNRYREGDILEGNWLNGEIHQYARYTGTNKQTIAGKVNYKGFDIYGLVNYEGKWYAGTMKAGKIAYIKEDQKDECLEIYKQVLEYLETERKKYNTAMSDKAIADNQTKQTVAPSSTASTPTKTDAKKADPVSGQVKATGKTVLFNDWNSAKKYEWFWLETEKTDSLVYRVITDNTLGYIQYSDGYTWALADLKLGMLNNFTFTANLKILTTVNEKGGSGLLLRTKNINEEKSANVLFILNPLYQTYWFGFYNPNTEEWKTLNKYEGTNYNIFHSSIKKFILGSGSENLMEIKKSGNTVELFINSQKVETIAITEQNSILSKVFGIGIASYQKGQGGVDKISFAVD